jgi:hypothetical protein
LSLAVFSAAPAAAISIQFDYSYDASGMFNNPAAVAALQEAASAFQPFTDTLAAINPSGSNNWDARFTNPSTGGEASLANPTIPANTLVVYVGARNLGGSTLGQGGPGGWSASGFQSWIDLIWGRGEGGGGEAPVHGPSAYEFGPWGGSISFDTTRSNGQLRNWHYGINTQPSAGRHDFLSVAMHELGHVLGFGIADSFDNLVSNHRFFGSEAVDLYGGNYVPLHTDDSHWASGTTSPPLGIQTAMTPNISTGTRRLITPLDYAALADLGWSVPNELIYPDIAGGDFDADGDVDGDDFLIWQARFGGPGPQGDADQDGDVDGDDFLIWQNQFGSGAGAASGPSAIPEPATFAIVMLMLSWHSLRRRRR